ncbi:helix-turn-helix domain-containing protein [Flavobacterium sp. 3-210]
MEPMAKSTPQKNRIFELSSRHLMLENDIVVESGGCYEACKGSFYTNTNKLLFVTQGTMVFRHGSSTYEIMDNQMAFLRKDILVEYETGCPGNSNEVCYYLFSLEDQFFLEFVKLMSLSILGDESYPAVTIKGFDNRFLNYIDSLDHYFEKSNTVLLKVKLFELLFHVASTSREILNQFFAVKTNVANNFKAIIEQNVMNSVSIDELCTLTGRSQSSFRREFHTIYNMPPSQWMREKRLKKASEMLLTTKFTITDICYTLGFESIAHFSRLFKSYFGQTPTEFRLNSGAANDFK